MAAQDLTTIATLKLWLPITSTNTNDDASISRLITAVSQDFQRATGRPDLLMADHTEVHQGDGSSRMIAYHWPVISIATLTVGGSAIAASSDKIGNGWYIDEDIDPERIWNVYLNGYTFVDGLAVALDYTAGYVQPGQTVESGQIALPGDIEQAVIDWCTFRYKQRPNVSATQRRSTEGESTESPILDAPPNVLQVIERYKRCFPSIDRRADEREERMQRSAPKPGKKGR
jgi:hypothetical protein